MNWKIMKVKGLLIAMAIITNGNLHGQGTVGVKNKKLSEK